MTPEVSILLPVRDCEDTLDLCLRSIEAQQGPRFECVVVDDGSRDATLDVALGYSRRDERFRVLPEPHKGLVEALNTGLQSCTAPFIARMDGDDWMHRQRLAVQLAYLESHPELSGAGSHVRCFPRTREPSGRHAYESWLAGIRSAADVRADAFVECPIAHPTWMMRRDVLQSFGYRDMGWPEDYDLLLRLLSHGHEIGVVARRLLGWRDHEKRLSRTSDRYDLARFTACKAAHLASSFLSHDDEYILWGYGDTGRELCRALGEHGKRPHAIVELHPGRIGQRIQGARVIRPEQIASVRKLPLVASVAGADARSKIRAHLQAMGREEGGDFVCAA